MSHAQDTALRKAAPRRTRSAQGLLIRMECIEGTSTDRLLKRIVFLCFRVLHALARNELETSLPLHTADCSALAPHHTREACRASANFCALKLCSRDLQVVCASSYSAAADTWGSIWLTRCPGALNVKCASVCRKLYVCVQIIYAALMTRRCSASRWALRRHGAQSLLQRVGTQISVRS